MAFPASHPTCVSPRRTATQWPAGRPPSGECFPARRATLTDSTGAGLIPSRVPSGTRPEGGLVDVRRNVARECSCSSTPNHAVAVANGAVAHHLARPSSAVAHVGNRCPTASSKPAFWHQQAKPLGLRVGQWQQTERRARRDARLIRGGRYGGNPSLLAPLHAFRDATPSQLAAASDRAAFDVWLTPAVRSPAYVLAAQTPPPRSWPPRCFSGECVRANFTRIAAPTPVIPRTL